MYHNAGLGQRAALGKPALARTERGPTGGSVSPGPRPPLSGERQLQRTGQAAAASSQPSQAVTIPNWRIIIGFW